MPWAWAITFLVDGSYRNETAEATFYFSYYFPPKYINNFAIMILIKDREGFTYKIVHAVGSYANSSCSTPSVGEPYAICIDTKTVINDVGDYTAQAYAWTDLQNPIPLAEVARYNFTVFDGPIKDTVTQIRKGDLKLVMQTPKARYGSGIINVTFSITNLGVDDLTIRGNNQFPLRISLYSGRGDAVYVNATPGYARENSCTLNHNKLILSSPVLELKPNISYNFVCGYHIRGGHHWDQHYVAIGKLRGVLEPWDEEVFGQKPVNPDNIISTKPIHFTVFCGECG